MVRWLVTRHDGEVPGTDLITRATNVATSLHRQPEGARVAGLCVGVSDRTGIDVTLLRVCVVFGALFFGVGLAVYACAWTLVPAADSDQVPLSKVIPAAATWDPRRRVLVTLWAGGVTFLLLASSSPFSILAVAIALASYVYLRNKSATEQQRLGKGGYARQASLSAYDVEPARLTASKDADLSVDPGPLRPHEVASVPASLDALTPVTVTRHSELTRRPHRTLLGLFGLVLAGGVASFAYLGARNLTPTKQLMVACAAALATLGLLLIVSAMFAWRPRFLMLAGLIVALWIGGLHLGMVNNHGSWGSVVSGNGSVTTPRSFVGTHTTLALADSDAGQTIHLSARASQLLVTVPANMDAEVHFDARFSSISLGGNAWNGADRDTHTVLAQVMPDTGNAPKVVLVIQAYMSNVEVRHA